MKIPYFFISFIYTLLSFVHPSFSVPSEPGICAAPFTRAEWDQKSFQCHGACLHPQALLDPSIQIDIVWLLPAVWLPLIFWSTAFFSSSCIHVVVKPKCVSFWCSISSTPSIQTMSLVSKGGFDSAPCLGALTIPSGFVTPANQITCSVFHCPHH